MPTDREPFEPSPEAAARYADNARLAAALKEGIEIGRSFAYEEMAQSDKVAEIHASTIYATGVTQGLLMAADMVEDMARNVDAVTLVTGLRIAAENLRAEAKRQ